MRKTFYALLLVVFTLTSCSKTDDAGNYIGTYELVTIDGNPLPFSPAHEGGAPEVLASTLTLAADGTFQMSMTYATTAGNSASRDFTGTYTIDQTTLRFVWEGAGVTPGTLDGKTLTIVNEGIPFTYEK